MSNGLSRPKNQIRWLLLEGISQSAISVLNENGYHNVERVQIAYDKDALIEALQGTQIVGVRSRS